MKLCKDCQHFRAGLVEVYCYRHGTEVEPVWGKVEPINLLYAKLERASPRACGKEAKYFLQNAQSI